MPSQQSGMEPYYREQIERQKEKEREDNQKKDDLRFLIKALDEGKDSEEIKKNLDRLFKGE